MSAIIVVEPHPLLRLGIIQLLSAGLPEKNISGADYTRISEVQGDDLGPVLVLLSISTLEGLPRLVTEITQAYSPQSILLLYEDDLDPREIRQLPTTVVGFVKKNSAPEVLQASVKLVLAGGTCFPFITQKDAPALRQLPAPLPPVHGYCRKLANRDTSHQLDAPLSECGTETPVASECEKLCLTPRQYEVLVLLARGYPMKTVGRLLNISVATAKAHTEMLYQRLDVHSRNAAVYEAVSRGATLGWPSIATAQQNTNKLSAPQQ